MNTSSQTSESAATAATCPDTSQVGAYFIKPSVQPPAHFNASVPDVGEQWKIWRQMWDNYSILTNLSSQPQTYQTALLLHCLGPDGVRVYNGLKFADEDESKLCRAILDKLNLHFLGETREFFERFKFNQRSQEAGESVEQYVTVLRTMSKTCGFCSCMKDKLLMDRLLLGVRDDRMREQMMATPDLTLSKAIDTCKAVEATATQMKALKQDELVQKLDHKHPPAALQPSRKFGKQKTMGKEKDKAKAMNTPQTRRCKFCCTIHPMRKELCPAWGRTCSSCHKRNHFRASEMCDVHAVNHGDDSSDASSVESISTVTVNDVHAVHTQSGPVYCKMIVNDHPVKFQIDCGATVNLLPQKYLGPSNTIRPEQVQLQMWNKSRLQSLGRCKLKTYNPATKVKYNVDYVIVAEDFTPLLSKNAAEKMNLVTIHYAAFEQVNSVLHTNTDFVSEYPNVFSTTHLGTLPGPEVHLTVCSDATPVVRPARTVPESLKDAVKAKLESLKEKGVIEEVDGPTDWVSQMSVAQKKSGDVRICIDPRPLNTALKREHYTLPVLDDILPSLTKATAFSICDLKDGYLHCPLDDDSSLLTTFATPWGRFKWTRLPFGLKVSSEIFQKRLNQALDGLDGVSCVADDIIIWGNDAEEHDRRLHCLLKRCQDLGVVLNADKSKFYVKEVPFLGHIVTDTGLKADPSKVAAILDMRSPSNKDDVHRLRGMVNYLSRYLPCLSDIMQPINDLTRKDVAWTWNDNHERAFKEIKKLLTEAPVLAYFDQSKRIEIFTDASASGIGAALLQDGHPVAYASRALTDPETRYAVIEKEMLAIVFALEKWNQLTYGHQVTILTDHKPLESIGKKSLDKAPKRLQSMLLRAMAYDIDIQYVKGKDNHLADPLSRSYLPHQVTCQQEFEAIHSVCDLCLTEDKLADLKRAYANDETMQTLVQTILEGWPEHKAQVSPLVTPYYHVRDELSTDDGIVFRGQRLVVPKTMRSKLKDDLHAGHSGVESTLRRAREYLFWPGMSQEIREFVQTCETCQEHAVSHAAQPMMAHDVPSRPWAKIGIDLFHYKDDMYLIMVCYFSNFFEIEKLHRTNALPVIAKLKQHCGRYGIPDTIVSDNGPPFSSREFAAFTKEWGITHQTISPHHSRSNGKAESAVKTAKRLLKKCHSTGEDVNIGLLNIRNTPTQGIGSSPSQRFFGRRTKTLLPTVQSLLQPEMDTTKDAAKIKGMQQRQAKYFNRNTKTLKDLPDGAVVRMKPFQTTDKTWKKATVLRKVGERSYEVDFNGQVLRRNREHIRASKERPPEAYLPAHTNHSPETRNSGNAEGTTVEETDGGKSQPASRPSSRPSHDELHGAAQGTASETVYPSVDQPEPLRRSSRKVCVPRKMKDFIRY